MVSPLGIKGAVIWLESSWSLHMVSPLEIKGAVIMMFDRNLSGSPVRVSHIQAVLGETIMKIPSKT